MKKFWYIVLALIIIIGGIVFFAQESAPNGEGDIVFFTQESAPNGEVCIQVITTAQNISTGEVRNFPTPCDVPEGWAVVSPEESSGEEEDISGTVR